MSTYASTDSQVKDTARKARRRKSRSTEVEPEGEEKGLQVQ